MFARRMTLEINDLMLFIKAFLRSSPNTLDECLDIIINVHEILSLICCIIKTDDTFVSSIL